MPKPPLCPVCGSALAPSAPEGLCPKCLWASLFTTEIENTLFENTSVPLGTTGDYELLNEIARGGMGVVYRARQTSLNRIVALKMILTARLPGEVDMKRFRAETEAVASLEHPNIVPIYDVGDDEGRPFFTMKFITGGSLAERLIHSRDSLNPPSKPEKSESFYLGRYGVRDIAALIAKIARAVHFAHQRGILHRDLKPSNILLDGRGEPLVTDFGLAKQIETDHNLTLSGAVLGTPAYMAPEQAIGGRSVSTAADVYSLGAIFYELLAGRPPFTGASVLETLQKVLHEDPIPPRLAASDPTTRPEDLAQKAHRLSIDRDLETICLKCLHKQPVQRYASAESLADDLERWLRHEPIHARPVSLGERWLKWARRRPAQAISVAAGMLVPAIIISILLVTGADVRRERNHALEQEQKAKSAAREAIDTRAQTRRSLYAADMLLAQHALDDGNLGLARSLIKSYQPAKPGLAHPDDSSNSDLRGFEWRHLWKEAQGNPRTTLSGHSDVVNCVAFSPDGKTLASAGNYASLKFWNVPSGTLAAACSNFVERPECIKFSPDGRFIACGSENGTVVLWNIAAQKIVWTFQGRPPVRVLFSGPCILVDSRPSTGEDQGLVKLFDWAKAEMLGSFPGDLEDISRDGATLATSFSRTLEVTLWNVMTGEKIRTLTNMGCSFLALSSDGQKVASCHPGAKEVQWCDATGHSPSAVLTGHRGAITALGFSPDGALLATASRDQSLRLWDAISHRECSRLLGHVNTVTDLAFSPDGKLLATSSADHTIILWPITSNRESDLIISNTMPPYLLSPDGTKLAAMTGEDKSPPRRVQVYDLLTHHSTVLGPAGNPSRPEFFSTDNQTFFAKGPARPDGSVALMRWSVNDLTHAPMTTWLALPGTNGDSLGAISPDQNMYTIGRVGIPPIVLLNPITGARLGELNPPRGNYPGLPYRFSPDGRKLVVYNWSSEIRLVDLSTPEKAISVQLPSRICESAFSLDRKILAVACMDHTIRLLDSSTLDELGVLRGHQEAAIYVAFSPDGRTLASCATGGEVKLWSWAARREVATLAKGGTESCFLSFTPDGNSLIAGGWGETRIFHLPSLAEIDAQP